MPVEAITTVATVPAVIALVTLAKNLGLPTKLSPLLALVLGVALSLFAAVGVGAPVDNWYEPVSMGLILGLSASGLYDGAKAIGASKTDTTVVVQDEDPTVHISQTRSEYRAQKDLQ